MLFVAWLAALSGIVAHHCAESDVVEFGVGCALGSVLDYLKSSWTFFRGVQREGCCWCFACERQYLDRRCFLADLVSGLLLVLDNTLLRVGTVGGVSNMSFALWKGCRQMGFHRRFWGTFR